MTKKYDIVGIGNAIVDVVCFVDDEFLFENNLTKGGMFLIDDKNAELFSELKYEKISSGGSAANTVATMAMLGLNTSVIGKIGEDNFGDLFAGGLKEINCDFICETKEQSGTTAKSFVFITPDGERTMCTYLGLASKIENEIDEKVIPNSNILYIEGYLWDQEDTIAALRHSIKIAKDSNTKIAFTLSDAFCVQRHQSEFLNVVADLDILFANEAEMNVLIGDNFDDKNYQKVKEVICQKNPDLIVAMTRGEKGAVIFKGSEFYIVPTHKVEKVIDTTGAGDSFAAGFLYGIIGKLSLENSAKFGNKLAGSVIAKVGARLEKSKLLELKN